MISDDELSAMQETQEVLMTDSAQIWRLEQTPDDTGGIGESDEMVVTMKCRIAAPTVLEKVIAGKESPSGIVRVTFPAESDIRMGDRLDLSNGQIVDVLGFVAPGTIETARVVLAGVRDAD